MGKGRRGSERAERLLTLFNAGDHGQARRLAAEVLGDAGASEADREAAAQIRARTAPDAGATIAAIAGAVVAVVLSAWLVSR